MHRLICAFVVRIWHKQVFSWHGSYGANGHRWVREEEVYYIDPKQLDRKVWANSVEQDQKVQSDLGLCSSHSVIITLYGKKNKHIDQILV